MPNTRPVLCSRYAHVCTAELPAETERDEATGELRLPPLTEWEALNIARNILHAIIFAQSYGGAARMGEAEFRKAEPFNSDTRQAMLLLEQIQARTPRG